MDENSQSVKPEFTKLDPPEKSRVYVFPGGDEVRVNDVSAICVRPIGTHRLETASGEKYIVTPGWLAIRLDVVDWTF